MTRTIAPGLRYSRILDRRGPKRLRLLRMDPSRAVALDVAVPGGDITGTARTSAMARASDAVAAINGTFFLPSGRPVYVLAEDGRMLATPLLWGRAMSLSADERAFFAGHPHTLVEATSSELWSEVHDVNETELAVHELAAYTPAGGPAHIPPKGGCSVRLEPRRPARWTALRAGVERRYGVTASICGDRRLRRRDGIVLSARRTGAPAEFLRALGPGRGVTLSWTVGWRGALDVMGGNPLLLEGRRVVAPVDCGSFCARHPRTGIGVAADGDLLMMTVDGRQRGWSIGMSLLGFARALKRFGAVRAINLDGGGSTTMVVDGRVVNRPSDGGERRVGSALVVLRGRDPGEAAFDPAVRAATGARSETAAPDGPAAPGSALDPGSLGGLASALSRGELGGPRSLPAALTRALRHPPAPAG
ncbi:MAG TPA: phosphodiester glycosidase family protein [Actinomycetota bacterium]|nr:phosphodiester glycosidase family protein [Actinomycetota bacterium]